MKANKKSFWTFSSKKCLLSLMFLVAMLMVTRMNFGQGLTDPTNFNLSMTVARYLEALPNPISWDFGTTYHTTSGGLPREELNSAYTGPWGVWDLAYANCPFSITISGDNAAGQGKPRFVRLEVGPNGTGYDVLSTAYQIGILTNAQWNNEFGLNYGVRAGAFPQTVNFAEAPHNGQVKMKMAAKVNSPDGPSESPGIPIRQTLISPGFTNDQSADAGVYTCTMLVTLTAL